MNDLLPIFMKLNNEPCLVVGGGNIAFQKIKQLLHAKAQITVVSPEIMNELISLPINIFNRNYVSSDIIGKKVVIAATDDKIINKLVFEDANKHGVPVNVVDQPDLCSFYMGSVYKDGDLKIAISTNGKCPSFGTYLRDYFNNISHGSWGRSLKELALKREKIIRTLKTYSEKKQIMGEIVKNVLKKKTIGKSKMGKVFLVGAGPGDPELITAKGLRAIQQADVILHDALIHPYLVFEINSKAKKIFVGKRQDKHSVSQESIHSIMIEEVSRGNDVVRLKGGDPFIFGRGGEEIMALAQKKITFEIIPGISAGIAAAAGFGIPLTHRDDATSVLFITGHQCKTSSEQDWEILAKLQSTLIFYMGVRKLKEIVMGLTRNGKNGTTPIAIVINATLISQKIILSTLDDVMNEIAEHKKVTPAIIIIGTVVSSYDVVQNYLNVVPSNMVEPVRDMDFDIWKTNIIDA